MPTFRIFLALGLTLGLAARAAGELNQERGTAFGARGLVGELRVPPIDRERIRREDQERAKSHRPPRFAAPHAVGVTPNDAGTWEDVDATTSRWRLRVTSPDARSLNFYFSRFRLPRGSRLEISTPDGSSRIRPFTARDTKPHGRLWTPILPGNDAVLELVAPKAAKSDIELELATVNRGYAPMVGGSLPPAPCNVDVACAEADPWRDQSRAVALITFDGIRGCSGSLVNNTAGDLAPYFLTASHCIDDPAKAASAVVYWNYENTTCRTPGSDESGAPGDGRVDQFQIGATLRASSSLADGDFALFELDDVPDPSFRPHWAGWDRRPVEASTATAIHHPESHEKRIALSFEATQPAFDPTFMRVERWDAGVIQPGSSGSPLFNQDGRVVGTLSGSFVVDDVCTEDFASFYGRFATNWARGEGPADRLREWLDPSSTDASTTEGTDPFPTFTLRVTPISPAICAPGSAEYAIEVEALLEFSGNVTLAVEGLPPGTSASFGEGSEVGPGASTMTVEASEAAAPGRYPLTISATGGGIVRKRTVELEIASEIPGETRPVSPRDRETDVYLRPTLHWSPVNAAQRYQVEVARDPDFTTSSFLGETSETKLLVSPPGIAFAPNAERFWRVSASNACGRGPVSRTFRFRTLAPVRIGNNTEDMTIPPSGPLAGAVVVLDGNEVFRIPPPSNPGDLPGRLSRRPRHVVPEKLFDLGRVLGLPLGDSLPTGMFYDADRELFGFLSPLSSFPDIINLTDLSGNPVDGILLSHPDAPYPFLTEGMAYLPTSSPTFPGHIVVVANRFGDPLCGDAPRASLLVVEPTGQVVAEILPTAPLACLYARGVSFQSPDRLLLASEGNVVSAIDFEGGTVGGPVTLDGPGSIEGVGSDGDGRILAAGYTGRLYGLEGDLTRDTSRDTDYGLGSGLSLPLGIAWDGTRDRFLIESIHDEDFGVFGVGRNLGDAKKVVDLGAAGFFGTQQMTYLPDERLIGLHHAGEPQALLLFDERGALRDSIDLLPTTGAEGFRQAVDYMPARKQFAVQGFSLFFLSRLGEITSSLDFPDFLETPRSFAFHRPDDPSGGRLLSLMEPGRSLHVIDLEGRFVRKSDPDTSFEAVLGLGLDPRDLAAITSGRDRGKFVAVDPASSSLVVFGNVD